MHKIHSENLVFIYVLRFLSVSYKNKIKNLMLLIKKQNKKLYAYSNRIETVNSYLPTNKMRTVYISHFKRNTQVEIQFII